MVEELYNVFKECFPTTLISKNEFEKKLDFDNSEVLKKFDESKNLIGYAIVRKNCISLICVRPEFQKKGYGTQLLMESEQKIRNAGYDEILLGYKSDVASLYMGVPILNNQNYNFFTKYEYDNDFTYYDVNIPNNASFEVPNNDEINQYTIVNTLEYPEAKLLFMQYLEHIDKKMFNRYFSEENMNYIFSTKDNKLVGMCAYKMVEEANVITIMDLVSYPSFDLNCKKIMLSEIKKLQTTYGFTDICARNVNNPILYQQLYNANIREKYWRGSKSC